METDDVRWLIALADGATVAQVAAAHHITQPAVSRGLKRLSSQIGAPLTERVGRRLQLTYAGEILVGGGRRMLAELDASLRALAEAEDPTRGSVRLGFLSPLGVWLVPSLIARFREEHPDVAIELRHDGATRILEALIAGELDLLLSEPPPAGAPPLSWRELFDEPLVLAVPAGHPLADRRTVRCDELADAPWVLQPEGFGLRRRVEELCAAAGFRPRPALVDHDLATLFALIGAGGGIGLFAAHPPPPAGVRHVALAERPTRPVGLLTRPDGAIGAAARAFAALAREHAPREALVRR